MTRESESENIDAIKILFARQWVQAEMAKVKHLNIPPFYVCSELMAAALVMTLGGEIDAARIAVTNFFDGVIAVAKESALGRDPANQSAQTESSPSKMPDVSSILRFPKRDRDDLQQQDTHHEH